MLLGQARLSREISRGAPKLPNIHGYKKKRKKKKKKKAIHRKEFHEIPRFAVT